MAKTFTPYCRVRCDILCVQELYQSQLIDLMPYLENKFDCIFFQRDFGEINVIFYLKERFSVLKKEIQHLEQGKYAFISDTMTIVQLEDLKTGKTIAILNTHLAFSPPDIREKQCYAILEQMQLIKDMPVIVTGDFNAFPNQPEKKLPFYDGDYVLNILDFFRN